MLRGYQGGPLLPRWGEHCGSDALSSMWLETSRPISFVQGNNALFHSWPLYVQIFTSHQLIFGDSFLAARLGLQSGYDRHRQSLFALA